MAVAHSLPDMARSWPDLPFVHPLPVFSLSGPPLTCHLAQVVPEISFCATWMQLEFLGLYLRNIRFTGTPAESF